MEKYAVLRNFTITNIIEITDNTDIKDIISKNDIYFNIETGNGTILIPEEYFDITTDYIYRDDIFISPQPSPTHRWSPERHMWIYDKRLDKPVGNRHVWDTAKAEWKQVIFTYNEFINTFVSSDISFLKRKLISDYSPELAEIEFYLVGLAEKIDIRVDKVRETMKNIKLLFGEYQNTAI